MMKTTKGRVAAEPFPDMSVQTTKAGTGAIKVTRIESKVGLVKLKVLLNSEDGRFVDGGYVFVKSANFTQPWAKDVIEVTKAGQPLRFILVPDAFVEVFVDGV